jgi:diguanylate cyclase (GGDEF)-like protein/PAS domain S-box-containing protein
VLISALIKKWRRKPPEITETFVTSSSHLDDLQAALASGAALSRRLNAQGLDECCDALGGMLRDATSSLHTFVVAAAADGARLYAYRSRGAAPLHGACLQAAADSLLDGMAADATREFAVEGLRFAAIPLSADGHEVVGALCFATDADTRIDAAALARLAGQGAARLARLRDAQAAQVAAEGIGEAGMLRTLFDNMPDQIYAKDVNGRFILGNRAAAMTILGTPDPQALLGKSDLDFFPLECGQRFFTDEQQIIRSGVPVVDQIEENLSKAGVLRYYSTTKFPFHDKEGQVAGIIGISRDVTMRVSADEVARLRDRAVESSQDGIVITGADAENYPIVYINPAFERITGFGLAEAKVSGIERFLLDDAEAAEGAADRRSLIARHGQQRVLQFRRKDGSQFWSEIRLAIIRAADGTPTHHVFTVVDVSEAHRAEEELLMQAGHDALTGLPNRRMLMQKLARSMAAGPDGEAQLALAFIDLDGLKRLNDEHGHEAGDVLLRAVADRISACIRKSDMIARLGGDEFVLLTMHPARGTDQAGDGVTEVLHKIQERIAQPLIIGETVIHPSCSIGVSLFGLHGMDPETLLRRADEAMYVAKKSGRNRIAFATRA